MLGSRISGHDPPPRLLRQSLTNKGYLNRTESLAGPSLRTRKRISDVRDERPQFASERSCLPVASLRPYSRNARTHSRRQIRQIADSIQKFGFTNPVLISDEDEIIAGHGRVEAARLLPCGRT